MTDTGGTDDDPMDDRPNEPLGPGEPRSFGNGRYTVQRRLGAGNFATVYQAFDERLDVPVAVKLLSDRWSWEPEVRSRFVQEARILRSLNDRHVVQIRDIAETEDGRPYLVMDYATEGTLETRLTQRAHAGLTVDPAELRELAAELAAALGVLHARRIAHRDIKPSNILITRDDVDPSPAHASRPADGLLRPGERLMLGDLGLAKDLRLDSGITVGVGTAGYMSPEQSELGAKIDTRTDIYAASALLGLIASGEPPDPLRRYSQGAITSGRPLPDRIAGAFRTALERGLDQDPEHRPATIEEWHAAVDAGLRSADTPADTPAGTTARRTRTRIGLLGAAATVLVVGGAWTLAGPGGDGDGRADPTTTPTPTTPAGTTPPTTTSASTTSTTKTPGVTTPASATPLTTAAPEPFVRITGPNEIPAGTDGRWWEVEWFGVVRGTWELADTAGPINLNGDEWLPGDGFRAELRQGTYQLRLTAFDAGGDRYVAEFTFTVV